MKKDQIQVGGLYTAKVSGKLTTVRVLAIREVPPAWRDGRWETRIDVVNTVTGRKTTFRSAAKLRGPAPSCTPAAAPEAPDGR